MVVRLECAGSLLRSCREYFLMWRSQAPWVVVKTDWGFFSILHLQLRQQLLWQADWTSSDIPRQMFSFISIAPQDAGAHSRRLLGKPPPLQTQRNPALLEVRAFLPLSTYSLPALTPQPLHMVSVPICSSAYTSALWCCPCMRQLKQARSVSVMHTPFSVLSSPHLNSEVHLPKKPQCFPGWSQINN